ncbi:MAG TPA: TRAP transporter substrate-binding protein [Casimicrobiaceae bacterium]|nr:TRAP transporter substrate-binding protein [Casimicrobiaceae bacterium]
MQRRAFLKQAGVGLATAAVTAPAIGQGAQQEVRWRLASSFPRNLDTLFGAAELIAKRCAAATNGRFQIRVFADGEVVPGLLVLDAVQNATVQCAHTAPYYFFGKDPTFAFACAIPFGMNARQQNAWMYHGGGLELMREFLQDYNIHNIPAGNTGAQMGGFFRKELKTVSDMKGLKMRIGGSAGVVMERLGLVPQQLAGGDIYSALEKGSIDAAEWVGPHDDERLGLYKIAKYYYYPGWWEGGPELDLFVNTKAWADLPKDYQAILEAACAEANVDTMAKYDALNPAALRRLVAAGVQLRPFPREIMQAAHSAAIEVYDQFAATNAKFRKVYEPWKRFRDDEILWFRVAEENFDQFMAMASRQSAAKRQASPR